MAMKRKTLEFRVEKKSYYPWEDGFEKSSPVLLSHDVSIYTFKRRYDSGNRPELPAVMSVYDAADWFLSKSSMDLRKLTFLCYFASEYFFAFTGTIREYERGNNIRGRIESSFFSRSFP